METGNGSALFSSVETGTSYPSSPELWVVGTNFSTAQKLISCISFLSVSGIQTELQKLRQELEFNFKRQGADGQIEETDQSVQTLSKPIQGDPEVAALAEMVRLQERLQKAENRAEVARGQLLRVHWRLLELKKTLRRGNLPLGLRQLGTVLQASGSAVKGEENPLISPYPNGKGREARAMGWWKKGDSTEPGEWQSFPPKVPIVPAVRDGSPKVETLEEMKGATHSCGQEEGEDWRGLGGFRVEALN